MKAYNKSLREKYRELIANLSKNKMCKKQKQLTLEYGSIDDLLRNLKPISKKIAKKRLKLLYDLCSKEFRSGKISIDTIKRLTKFYLKIIPLTEDGKIMTPTATEFELLVKWYIGLQAKPTKEPVVVLSTICPDYPYEKRGDKIVFIDGAIGNNIGLVGESIERNAPPFIRILSETLNISVNWIVGYAGFEARETNLNKMGLSFEEFLIRLKTSAKKIQQKINIPVGILPNLVNISYDQFNEIKDRFAVSEYQIHRNGVEALSSAVDARDWAVIYTIANSMNAIILDGASVFMGRKVYKKAKQSINAKNYTPMFFCVNNYEGFK